MPEKGLASALRAELKQQWKQHRSKCVCALTCVLLYASADISMRPPAQLICTQTGKSIIDYCSCAYEHAETQRGTFINVVVPMSV